MQELKVIQFRPAEDIHRKYKVTSVLSDEPFLIFYTEHSWIEQDVLDNYYIRTALD